MRKTKKTKAGEETDKKPVGKPTVYTTELGEEICKKISESKRGLSHICEENPHFPSRQTIHEWVINNKEFGDKYTRARELQAELLIDDLLMMSDDDTFDQIIDPKTGELKTNHEAIARSRLKVDTRKWLACKFYPKMFGDKVVNEHQGKDGQELPSLPPTVIVLPNNGRD